jgi:hypothetical protein
LAIERNRIERFKGAYYSGAWYDQEMGEFLCNFVNVAINVSEGIDVEGTSISGQDDISDILEFFRDTNLFNAGRHLPTREFMLDFCSLPERAVKTKWAERAKISVVQEPAPRPPTPQAIEAGHDFVFAGVVPRAFAAMRDAFRNLAVREAVPVSSAGQVNANTVRERAEKKFKREQLRKEREALRAKLEREKAFKDNSRSSAFARRTQGVLSKDEEEDIAYSKAEKEAEEQYEYEREMQEYVREQYSDEDYHSESDIEELDDEQRYRRFLIDHAGIDEEEELEKLVRVRKGKIAAGQSVRKY